MAAINAWNRQRHLAPRCRAKAKSTGERCGNVAMENGTCWRHGGKTPRGDGRWHRPAWPNGDAPDAEAKLQRKLRDQVKAEKRRQARIAAMTPRQRDRYAKWRASHAPTSTADRAARRRDRGQAKWLQDLLAQPERPKAATTRKPPADAEARRRAILIEIDNAGGIFL